MNLHSNFNSSFFFFRLLKPLQVQAGWCRLVQQVHGRSFSLWARHPTAVLPPRAVILAHGPAPHQVGLPTFQYRRSHLCYFSHSCLHTEYTNPMSSSHQWAPTVQPARCVPPAAGSTLALLLVWLSAHPLREGLLVATPFPGMKERPAACDMFPTGRLLPVWRDSSRSRLRNSLRRRSWR